MTDTEELREMIEEIDQVIIENIAMRMEIADKLAEAKKESSQKYWDENKEKEVINRYLELCEEVNLSEAEARKIAEVILHISKERQKHFFEGPSGRSPKYSFRNNFNTIFYIPTNNAPLLFRCI